jgi:hypothetical protein
MSEDWEPCTLRDDAWELDHGLSRLEYLRLLRLGYIRNGTSAHFPVDLWEELEALEDVEREKAAEVERLRREELARVEAERQALFDMRNLPEGRLEEYWMQQRQLGKTAAAERWAERHGVELPVILEAAETEDEMMEAIRKLKNVAAAKRQGQGLRKGAWAKREKKR